MGKFSVNISKHSTRNKSEWKANVNNEMKCAEMDEVRVRKKSCVFKFDFHYAPLKSSFVSFLLASNTQRENINSKTSLSYRSTRLNIFMGLKVINSSLN